MDKKYILYDENTGNISICREEKKDCFLYYTGSSSDFFTGKDIFGIIFRHRTAVHGDQRRCKRSSWPRLNAGQFLNFSDGNEQWHVGFLEEENVFDTIFYIFTDIVQT